MLHDTGVKGTGKRLLIVDDEESMLSGMRRYFEQGDYVVDCAREPEEAEALLDHNRYDCMVVDLCPTTGHSPDGLRIIIHARAVLPRTRILVLTAAEETATEVFGLGADAFLRKPVAPDEVAHLVGQLLACAP